MSIFFWKKKKAVPETEEPIREPESTQTPAEEPEAVPAVTEEPVVEETAAEPAPEEPAEEPVAEPAPEERAAEPVEEPVAEPAPEEPVEEPGQEEPVAEEPAEEPVTEPAPAEPVPEEPVAESAPEEPVAEPAPEPVQQEEVYVEKRHRSKAPLLIFLLLCIIGGSYYYGMVYSETHFLENTYINGIDVSNMTSPEVEKILSEKSVGYQLDLTFRDGSKETISGTEIGYKVKPDGSVDKILRSQDHKHWYKCFFRRTDGQVEQNMTYDPDRLEKAVGALPELQESNMIRPKNAYIELTGTTFNIIPEVEGDTIKVALVQKAAREAVNKGETAIDVASIKGAYLSPKVRAKDKEIVEKCDSYNKMLAGSITWELPDGEKMTVDAETTVGWLSVDDKGNYYRDEDKWEENIEFWVDELARNVNTVGKTWNFHATNVGDIEVDGGDYGYSVDKPTEREEVWNLLWDGESEEREPYFYQKQYSSGSGIGGTYIEANLSRQHVWIYIDGEMVLDTDCVSGLPSAGRGTPTGVFQILYKDTDTDLKGQLLANGQYSYISHVDYWMPFYGGCGFHDASWRSSFGGNIYQYDGSHGCINLPPSVAPAFYNYVRTGMPVVVFY
ncbi:MAG TPA: hypothetical protein DCF49_07645 [Lachnospiraceae bacterium]|nr:hypothetical protein [Lachnospiraceae bacterium]